MPCRIRFPLPRASLLLTCSAILLLAGCEQLGIETPETMATARAADGRAVGGACRHAGRALEDCFVLNKKVDRAAVFAGWRDMNDYMRENKINTVAPVLSVQQAQSGADDEAAADAEEPRRANGKKVAAARP